MRRLSCNGSIQSPYKILQTKPSTKTQEAKLVKRPTEIRRGEQRREVGVAQAFQPHVITLPVINNNLFFEVRKLFHVFQGFFEAFFKIFRVFQVLSRFSRFFAFFKFFSTFFKIFGVFKKIFRVFKFFHVFQDFSRFQDLSTFSRFIEFSKIHRHYQELSKQKKN